MARIGGFAGRVITFGEGDERRRARRRRSRISASTGTRCDSRPPDGDVGLRIPLLGRGNLSNVLAASAVAIELERVAAGDCRARLDAHARAASRRGRFGTAKGITVVDDSYNSSPTALKRALEVVAADRTAARKAAVLGEMLELGDHAMRLHEASRARRRADRARSPDRGRRPGGGGAGRGGCPGRHAGGAVSATSRRAQRPPRRLTDWLKAGDLVLVKGSRGIKTDLVVDRITAEFA